MAQFHTNTSQTSMSTWTLLTPLFHPPGCQYRGPLRAPCSDIFPPGSAILPESHQEGHSSGPSLDTSNCGPLCCISALQGAGCDCPGTVSSVGAKVLADVWEQFDTAKKYSEKVRFSPTTCPLFQNCNDTPLEILFTPYRLFVYKRGI